MGLAVMVRYGVDRNGERVECNGSEGQDRKSRSGLDRIVAQRQVKEWTGMLR